jgi:hypothetical protein
LDEVKRVADKAAANVRTMGVALSTCIVPEVGKPSFTLKDEMGGKTQYHTHHPAGYRYRNSCPDQVPEDYCEYFALV